MKCLVCPPEYTTFVIKYDCYYIHALSPLLFNFALEYIIRRVQVNQDGMKLNVTQQFLDYAVIHSAYSWDPREALSPFPVFSLPLFPAKSSRPDRFSGRSGGGCAKFSSESTFLLVDTWTSTHPWGNYFSSFLVWDRDEGRPGPRNFGVAAPQTTGVRNGRNACLGFWLLYWKSISLAFWLAPRACVAQLYFTSNGTLFPLEWATPFHQKLCGYIMFSYSVSFFVYFICASKKVLCSAHPSKTH